MIIQEKPKQLFEILLEDYSKIHDIDIEKSHVFLKEKTLFKMLTDNWYKHLETGNTEEALKVYDHDYYFVDIFDCFITYSRQYIKSISKLSNLADIKSFVDLGCGLSYSTIALKQLFPNAKGYATNLKKTKQWNFCKKQSKAHGFKLIESVSEIKHDVDLVFASEYFEHIFNPINHVNEVIKELNPKILVIANAFNTESIGHFIEYEYEKYGNTIKIPQKIVSRLFDRNLTYNKYTKIKTGFWNNRPNVWIKNES